MRLSRTVFATSLLFVSALGLAADRAEVVSEADLGNSWVPAPGVKRVVAGYPAVSDKTQDVCVSIGYKIQTDGSTSDFVLLKAWSAATPDKDPPSKVSDPFMQMGAAVVSMRRFAPASASVEPKTTFTSASFAFPGSGKMSGEQLGQHCRIDDLPSHVAKMQTDAHRRGNMDKARQESSQQQPYMPPPRVGGN